VATKLLEIALGRALQLRLSHREARVVPYRRSRVRMLGCVDGGGRIDVGARWPDAYLSRAELIVQRGGCCTVHGNFRLYGGSSVVVSPGARLTLGDGFMNNGASIVCFSQIALGDGVVIGPGASIRDSDSHTISGSSQATQPISIGDHVWIGERAMILKGVTIHDGAIIAAGSIVTQDVEAGALVAGVPARFVRPATWSH